MIKELKMNRIDISVVIPVYKVEDKLERCINSVLNQTFNNFEIILVDDASPDRSGEICERYKNKFPKTRIVIIHKNQNEGLGMARNTALEHVNGKYVFFLDSDDMIAEKTLESLWTKVKETNADTVLGSFVRITRTSKTEVYPIINKNIIDREDIKKLIVKMLGPLSDGTDSEYHMAAKNLYSIDVIKENKIQFESERKILAEDCIFNLDYLSKAKRIAISTYPGYQYYDNENSLTTSYRKNRFELLNNLNNAVETRLNQFCIDQKEFIRFKRTYLVISQRCISQEVAFNRFKDALKKIRGICTNSTVSLYAKEIRKTDSSLKQKLMCSLLSHDHCLSLYLIFYIYNKKKGR